MSLASIDQQRAHWAHALRQLADKLDHDDADTAATNNHLASILPFEIGAMARGLVELYGAVEAQRSVAFAQDAPK